MILMMTANARELSWMPDMAMTKFCISANLDISRRAAYRVGGFGLRHQVEARLVNADDDEDPDPDQNIRRMAALYFEVNRWFLAVKTARQINGFRLYCKR